MLALARGERGQAYIGASVQGAPVGILATAIARRVGFSKPVFHVISADAAAAERGESARGYALDQRLSSSKAMRELGWTPLVTDPSGALDLGPADQSSSPPEEVDNLA